MALEKMSRARRAGVAAAEAIIEMVNLMYQNKTALNFFKGLLDTLKAEYKRRLIKRR